MAGWSRPTCPESRRATSPSRCAIELSITGELKERERAGILRRRTRRTGQFDYRVRLPGELGTDDVDARLDEGVLTVRIPKPTRAQPRRIEIKGG